MEKILSVLLICAVAAVAQAEATLTTAPLAGIHGPALSLLGALVMGGVVASLGLGALVRSRFASSRADDRPGRAAAHVGEEGSIRRVVAVTVAQ